MHCIYSPEKLFNMVNQFDTSNKKVQMGLLSSEVS